MHAASKSHVYGKKKNYYFKNWVPLFPKTQWNNIISHQWSNAHVLAMMGFLSVGIHKELQCHDD